MRDDEEPLNEDLLRRALAPDTPAGSRRSWDTDGQWRALRDRIAAEPSDEPPIPLHRRSWTGRQALRWLATAAALTLAVGGTWYSRVSSAPHYRTASTARGQRATLRLDDGTQVILGPASTLRYDVTSRARRVELSGLAQFHVVHDAARPFVVHAAGVEATDVGTEFTVRAFGDEDAVVLAVTEGEIALRGSTGGLSLTAGQVGRVDAKGIQRLAGTPSDYAQWVGGQLAFQNATLSDVARELARWFDADVRVDARVAQRRVSATYASPTLDGVLSAITRATGIRVERTSGGYLLLPRSDSERP
ncbi:MAG: FecR domain-containing protein [Gemmatimonadetes bacterium]|nr:FecR domain-containing protein [Gemmatimonadota bacterium]